MPTTAQMIVIIRCSAASAGRDAGAFLDAADSRQQAVQLLAAQITDPASVQSAYQEAVDMAPNQAAIEMLLKEQGRSSAQFSREFGGIRQMGPAKLEREAWLYPKAWQSCSTTTAWSVVGLKAQDKRPRLIYLPSDITPWLPHPPKSALSDGLPIIRCPLRLTRTIFADDKLTSKMWAHFWVSSSEQLRLISTGRIEDVISWCSVCRCPDETMPG